MRRVTVVTGKHLATCPRMLKAADALHDAGYRVRVVSVDAGGWASAADRQIGRAKPWSWSPVPASREASPMRWAIGGARFRAARAIAVRMNGAVRREVAERAIGRTHDELVAAILAEPFELVYAGTTGAIAAALDAAAAAGAPCGIDFEDLHCAEQEWGREGAVLDGLAALMMTRAVKDAAFLTAGSAAIADACAARFGRRPIPIHNVFPLPARAPRLAPRDGALKLYWFSQTIGPFRGLEETIAAAGAAGIPCEIHLRGVAVPGYVATLERLAADHSQLRVVVHAPSAPGEMVAACAAFDAGIAAEQAHIENRAVALTNKALTYPLAGLPVTLTETPGQRALGRDLGEGAITYLPGAIDRLADGLARWGSDAAALRRAKEASWEAARTRWHWEHADERDALVAAVSRVW